MSNRKAVRGGSWYFSASNTRVASRRHNSPGISIDYLGFRLVRSKRSGSFRVARGGSWYNSATLVRVAFRISYYPNSSNRDVGFRLCRINQGE